MAGIVCLINIGEGSCKNSSTPPRGADDGYINNIDEGNTQKGLTPARRGKPWDSFISSTVTEIRHISNNQGEVY